MEIYLVGGAVRDQLLGLPVRERDYVVVGATEAALLQRFPNARPASKRLLTYIVDGEEYTLSQSLTIQDDLNTRDLTINACARDESDRLFLHPRTEQDLKHRILRPVVAENFFHDPNRLYRAARFTARFSDFTVTEELLDTCTQTAAGRLHSKLAAERPGMEFRKSCSCPMPGNFLRFLHRVSPSDPWFSRLIPDDAAIMEEKAALMDRAAGSEACVAVAAFSGLSEDAVSAVCALLRLPKRLNDIGRLAIRLPHPAHYAGLPLEDKLDLLLFLMKKDLLEVAADCLLNLHDRDIRPLLLQDAARIRDVSLPEQQQNLGPESGAILRRLRLRALAALGESCT